MKITSKEQAADFILKSDASELTKSTLLMMVDLMSFNSIEAVSDGVNRLTDKITKNSEYLELQSLRRENEELKALLNRTTLIPNR